ncbi:MAG: helix-turn-helix transcriptional regulator [Candidatus Poribacteria bacterium]|nr:helix-turn-helix transcriptional regulator [Candidatus Poribacteria bacterium]
MSIRCRLAELLNQRGEGQREFAERVGLSRQTVSKLYANHAAGIEFATLEKTCLGLGIPISELLDLEEPELSRRVRRATDVTVVLGATVMMATLRGQHPEFGMLPDQVEAAFHLVQQITLMTDPAARVNRYWFPAVTEWGSPLGRRVQDEEGIDWRQQAASLLSSARGIVFIVGTDLVNGFVEFCLDRILDVDYDPRGKTRRPRRVTPRYRMNFPLWKSKGGRVLSDNLEDRPEAAIDTLDDRVLFEMNNVAAYTDPRSTEITLGSIVFVDEPNVYHPHCTLVGIVGSIPRADAVTAKHLLQDAHLKTLDARLRQAGAFSGPMFVVARIDARKGDPDDRFSFVI